MATTEREKDRAKNERLGVRTTRPIKNMIQRAADIEGRTMTDFMLDALKAAAGDVIKKYEEETVIRLSKADSEAFVRALLNPSAPNERLKKAARRYRARTDDK